MQSLTFPRQCLMLPILPHQQYRHRFTKEEDETMLKLINQFEDKDLINWNRVASNMPNRTPRQCRERYLNYLLEKTKKGNWTKEEDELIMNLYEKFGPKWAKMTSYFEERSNIDIKNRYSALLRRQQYDTYKNPNKNTEIYNNQIVSEIYCDQIKSLAPTQYNYQLQFHNSQIDNYPYFHLNTTPNFSNPIYQIVY